jgi:hypothetical protein
MKKKTKLLRNSSLLKNGNIFVISLLLIIITASSFSALNAQVPMLPENADFFSYLSSFYNSDRYNPSDTTEGGEKAQHERLKKIWGTRLHPHGDFGIANKAIIDYANNYEPVNVRTENPH